jgi:hypothetical protein
MAKRIRRKPQSRATHARCRWCGKELKITKDRRLPKHKAIHDYEYRDDDLCPGTDVLVKHLPPVAVSTHPQAMEKNEQSGTRKGTSKARRRVGGKSKKRVR